MNNQESTMDGVERVKFLFEYLRSYATAQTKSVVNVREYEESLEFPPPPSSL